MEKKVVFLYFVSWRCVKIQNEGVLRNYRGEKVYENLKWKSKVGSAVLATALAGSMVLPATAYAQGEICSTGRGNFDADKHSAGAGVP